MAALLATLVLLGLCSGASAQFGVMQDAAPGYFYFYGSGQVHPARDSRLPVPDSLLASPFSRAARSRPIGVSEYP